MGYSDNEMQIITQDMLSRSSSNNSSNNNNGNVNIEGSGVDEFG